MGREEKYYTEDHYALALEFIAALSAFSDGGSCFTLLALSILFMFSLYFLANFMVGMLHQQ